MCGLVGMFSMTGNGFAHGSRDVFYVMMLLNGLRGIHSTGMAGVTKDGKVDLLKGIGGIEALSTWKDTDTFFGRIYSQYRLVLGHGRYATRGNITAMNAHPHESGPITLIHNGTMTNFDAAVKDFKGKKKYETDSELCTDIIARDGIEELVKSYNGGFAFMAFNRETNELQIVRNYERTLFMYKRSDRDEILFSSEDAVFHYLEKKFNIQGSVFYFKPGCLYTFKLGERDMPIRDISNYGGKYGQYKPPVSNFFPKKHYRGGSNNARWTQEELELARARDGMDTLYDAISQDPRSAVLTLPKAKDTTVNESGRNYRLGDRIRFVINDVEQRTGQDNLIMSWLNGFTIASSRVAVSGMKMGVLDFTGPGKKIGVGSITSMLPLDEDKSNGLLMRIHVRDINILGEDDPEDAQIVEMKPTQYVMLADGAEITRTRYLEMIRDGCGLCGYQEIKESEHKYCTIAPNPSGALMGGAIIICPECTRKNLNVEPKNVAQNQMH